MAATVVIYSTAPDLAVAERIGRQLVEEGLVACINCIPGMRSVYRWQGRIESADEVVLILKTRADLAAEAGQRLKALHPYQEPCVVELPISGGSPTYLAWIAAETRESSR